MDYLHNNNTFSSQMTNTDVDQDDLVSDKELLASSAKILDRNKYVYEELAK